MPSSTWTAISLSQTTSDNWTPIGSYTAPSDGYIQLQGEATADASQLAIRTENNGEVRGSFICRTVYQVSGVNLVVAKGQTCLLLSSHSKNIKARFYQIIGGGYQTLKKLILQGGGLCCLKHSYSSLRRSSCRVRDRGFNTQLVRPWMQRPSVLQPTVIGTRLHPAGTVMSHTLETPQALFWKSLTAAQVSLILNRLQDGTLFLYRKAKNLVISFQQIQQCRFCTLSQCGLKTNSAVGGASC